MTLTRFRLMTTSMLFLCAASPAYAGQPFAALAQDDKTVGVQVKIQSFTAKDAQQIKASGFGFVRLGVWTNSLGTPSYQQQISEAFAAAKTAELPVLMTVRSTKPLTSTTNSSDSDLAAAGEAFARSVISLDNAYRSQLVAIEIWNEPDLPKYWPTQDFEVTFAPFMNAVCRGLQKRDTSTPLIGFGFAKAPTQDSKATVALNKIINDHPKCLSAISYHPYGMSSAQISNAQAFILDNFHLPGVISEWGVPSLSSIGGTTGQASRITQFISDTRKLNIPLTSIYEWKNSDSGGNDRERSFGILSSDGTSKPAATAVKSLLKSH